MRFIDLDEAQVGPAPLAVPLFLPKLPGLSGGEADIANVVGARMAMFIGASYVTLRTLHTIIDALPGLGVEVFPSDANFVLFRPPRPAAQEKSVSARSLAWLWSDSLVHSTAFLRKAMKLS